MDGYFKRQLASQNRGTALASRPTGDALYAGCLPRTSSTGAHALTVVREHASQSKGPCWTGYHRDYSKKEGSNDSCVKNGTSKKKKKKKKTTKTKEGDGSSSSSSSSGDEDGKPKKKKKKKDCDGDCK
jgi:hypothetical protein